MTEYVGQQFGHYRLTRLLGQGGFADVYLGEHIHLGSLAAVKILYARLVDEHQEDFLNEARMLARLSHPHIIRMLDFGIEGGIPFLIMEYAPHGTLRDQHPYKTKLPLLTAVDYISQICDGLQYAHDQKLIHRDLKPSNMLVGQGDKLLLSDFGVALISQTSYSQGLNDSIAGTMSYVAPELLRGQPQFASDQYSMGVIAYEWLCGVRPFQGTAIEMWAQHQSAPPPPLRQYVPDLPLEVEQVVLTALVKDPSKRFANVRAFATALKAASQPGEMPEITSADTSVTKVVPADEEDTVPDSTIQVLPVTPSPPTPPVVRIRYGKKKRIVAAIVAVALLFIASTFVYAMNSKNGSTVNNLVAATATSVQTTPDGSTAVASKGFIPTATVRVKATQTSRSPKTTHATATSVPVTSNTAPVIVSTAPPVSSSSGSQLRITPTSPPPPVQPTVVSVKPTPTSPPATVTHAVDGQNPTTYVVNGETCEASRSNSTPESFNLGGVTGTLYFRFSITCHAAWALIVFNKAVSGGYGYAKIVRNNDGIYATCNMGGNKSVVSGQTSCYTGMVYDGPDVTASAYGYFTFSSGKTDATYELGPY
jgi:serine/threonine protein kinase